MAGNDDIISLTLDNVSVFIHRGDVISLDGWMD